jgi:hypothetical protein
MSVHTNILIPKAFARDRLERDLSNGPGVWNSGGYLASLSADELDELRSDAEYYATGIDNAPAHLVRAAQTLAGRIAKATEGPLA